VEAPEEFEVFDVPAAVSQREGLSDRIAHALREAIVSEKRAAKY